MFDFIKKLFSYEVVDTVQETDSPVVEGAQAVTTAERPAGAAGEQEPTPRPGGRYRMRPPITR